MDNRETGLQVIFERIQAKRHALGLVSFKRTPTSPSEIEDLPCVFMIEGTDQIQKPSSRGHLGYPAQRLFEVTLELVVNKRVSNVRELAKALRKVVFTEKDSDPEVYSAILGDQMFLQEDRTEGPIGYGLPDIQVIRVVFDLKDLDGGF